MDEIEFRKRLYANPGADDPEVIQAAESNPAYQKILDDVRELEAKLNSAVSDVPIPNGLAERLLSLPGVDADDTDLAAVKSLEASKASTPPYYYAMAACLILAVGVTLGFNLNRGPSSSDLAFGDTVLEHIYVDLLSLESAMDGSISISMPVVNQIMASTGSRLNNNGLLQRTPVRFALPCEVLPAFQSAHLAVQGNAGAVSIIVINNHPVDGEFTIRDDRYDGIVIPLEEGNMVLIGERNEELDQYKDLFSNSIDWVI
jgi:hypothetical protein